MKKTRKLLSLVLCAIVLVLATIATTVAYLKDETDLVDNTFAIGNVTIKLDEVQVDPYGVPSTKETINGEVVWTPSDEAPRVIANKYKLIPGNSYTKDPVIHVGPASENCHLFVKVVNGISDIEDKESDTIALQMAKNNWTKIADNLWVYGSQEKAVTVTENSDIPVFGSFKVTGDVEYDALDDYESASITIKAYAVQAAGFDGYKPSDIWDAAYGN